MTYREMWEVYVEPVLKAQSEIRKEATGDNMVTSGPVLPHEEMSVDHKVAEAQAAGFMFGANPLEVGKAVRKSHGKKVNLEELQAKLIAREQVKA